jgi:ketosteroid isomerase-like protein
VDEADLVRWEVDPLERQRRGVDDRIAIGFPGLSRRLRARTAGLPAGSRLRRAALTRAVRTGYAATNRDDYAVVRSALHPEVELVPPNRDEPALGFDPVYHGPEGVERFIRQWKSGFNGFRYEPREVADAGGARFALRLGMIWPLPGGTEVSDEYGVVFTLEDGLVRRQDSFRDWSDALAELTAT